ncbi:hypothetical protein GGR53DRAFT_476598 [Hypoxylon sp. FL1150]|nr:hypothetical protein GGR53DRAFT_476598 [Hypoxylon sp. FL1150]
MVFGQLLLLIRVYASYSGPTLRLTVYDNTQGSSYAEVRTTSGHGLDVHFTCSLATASVRFYIKAVRTTHRRYPLCPSASLCRSCT